MAESILLNASEYFVEGSGVMPQVTATIRDLGTFEALFFAFLVFVAAVAVHELAHWFSILKHRPDAVIIVRRRGIGFILQTGVESDYEGLTSEQKTKIYAYGVLAGLVPIAIATAIHPIYILVLPGYAVGCYRDVQLIVRESK